MSELLQPREKISPWIYAIFFIALALAYGNHFKNDFIFDDIGNIVENENVHMKEFTPGSVLKSFQGRGYEQVDRPLAFLSFACNYYFSGLQPWGYHAVNWAIHFGTTLLLFWTTLLLLRELRPFRLSSSQINAISFWNALLWSLHPVTASSVTPVVQRMNIGSTFFYLAAFLSYWKSKQEGSKNLWRILCALLWLCGMGMKETALTFPLFLILYEACCSPTIPKELLKKYAVKGLWILALLSPLLLWLYLHHPYGKMDVFALRPFTPWERVLTESRVLFYVLTLFFYPMEERLLWIHDITPSSSLFQPMSTGFAVVSWAFLILFCFRYLRKWPALSFPLLFFLLNHGIEASFISLELHYDYRNYQPSLFLMLPLLWGIYRNELAQHSQTLRTLFLCLTALFLSFQTLERNAVMKDNVSLWKDNAKKAPQLWVCQYSLAAEYRARKEYGPALEFLERAMQCKSSEVAKPAAHTLLLKALCLREMGKTAEALEAFEQATRQHRFPNLMYEYGTTLATLGQWEEAEKKLWSATHANILSPAHFYAYAVVLTHNHKQREALKELETARKRWPENPDLMRLEAAFLQLQKNTGEKIPQSPSPSIQEPSLKEKEAARRIL